MANIGQTPRCLPDSYVGGLEFLEAAIWESLRRGCNLPVVVVLVFKR